MPAVAIETPFNITLDFTTAPFGKRFLAWFIDGVIQLSYALAFGYAVWGKFSSNGEAVRTMMILLGYMLPLSLYHFLQEAFWHGQSIGKRAVGIKVVSVNGSEASLSQYALRALFRTIDIGVFSGIPAAISYFVTQYNQRIGDIVAGTLVIEKNEKADFSATIYRPVDTNAHQVLFPQVMRLTDRDLNGIRNLLATRSTAEHEVYMAEIAHRIREVLQIQDDSEPRAFLERLLEDYNAMTQKV